jgi:hypothetical protein
MRAAYLRKAGLAGLWSSARQQICSCCTWAQGTEARPGTWTQLLCGFVIITGLFFHDVNTALKASQVSTLQIQRNDLPHGTHAWPWRSGADLHVLLSEPPTAQALAAPAGDMISTCGIR